MNTYNNNKKTTTKNNNKPDHMNTYNNKDNNKQDRMNTYNRATCCEGGENNSHTEIQRSHRQSACCEGGENRQPHSPICTRTQRLSSSMEKQAAPVTPCWGGQSNVQLRSARACRSVWPRTLCLVCLHCLHLLHDQLGCHLAVAMLHRGQTALHRTDLRCQGGHMVLQGQGSTQQAPRTTTRERQQRRQSGTLAMLAANSESEQ